MCSMRECGRYCVRTATSARSELAQLERTKSMMRYFPPNGIAGFARFSARILRRLPSPPARIIVKTFIEALCGGGDAGAGPFAKAFANGPAPGSPGQPYG